MRSNIGLLLHPNAGIYKYLPCLPPSRPRRSLAVFGHKLTILKLSPSRADRRVSQPGLTPFISVTYENSRRFVRLASALRARHCPAGSDRAWVAPRRTERDLTE
uniref:Uncharacterized protein TP009.27 n=1 Tax=Halorubrum sp. TP009 TaxID=447099 RepID=A7U0Z3_9EURY|nr:hypothetical protein [Halorubrum sp. TP009]